MSNNITSAICGLAFCGQAICGQVYGNQETDSSITPAICGQAVCGQTVCGQICGNQETDISLLQSISITTPPAKTLYLEGELFNPAGMVVKAYYEDGTSKTLNSEDYTVTPSGALAAGTSNAVISYTFSGVTKTATQSITVEKIEIYLDSSKSSAEHGENPKVNLTTGRLLYVHPDINIGANSYGINIAHVYNSTMGNSMYDKFPGMGRGWKLNIQQYIEKVDENNYRYIDSMGYVHTFVKFDVARYNDTEGLGLVLIINSNTSGIIEDEAGNLIKFDSNGRLDETVSCENDAITKKYIYNNANQLVKIYDTRHGKSNPSRFVQLVYNSNTKMLSSISLHDSAVSNYKILELEYEYLNYRLVKITKKVFDTNGALISTKIVSLFEYNSTGKLEVITDVDTLSVTKIEYLSGDKVFKVAHGYTENINSSSYNLKSAVEYNYIKNISADGNSITYETTVINSKQIQLTHYINSKGVITGIFEKEGISLKSLTHRSGNPIISTNYSNGTINNSFITNFSTEQTIHSGNLNINRAGEENMKNYAFSCWLKMNTTYRFLKFELSYFIGEQNYFAYGNVDMDAYNVWQFISFPVKFSNTKTISNIKLKLLGKSSRYANIENISTQIADCRFAPSSNNQLVLNYGSKINRNAEMYCTLNLTFANNTTSSLESSIKTTRVDNANSAHDYYILHPDNYFSQSDYFRTVKNIVRSSNGSFDVVCCNGTRRIPNVKKAEISAAGYTAYVFGVEETKFTRFQLQTISADNKSITTTAFKFFPDMQRTETYVNLYEDIDNSNGATKVSNGGIYKNIDYKGKLWREGDVYQVATIYDYDDYGNLTSINKKYESLPTDPRVIKSEYNYDASREYVTSAFNGHKGIYKTGMRPFGLTSTEKNANYNTINDSHSESLHTNQYIYDEFKEKLLDIKTTSSGQVGNNTLAYENGRLRTANNGSSKYGVKHDLATGSVTFTVFDNGYNVLNQERNIIKRSVAGENLPGNTTITDKYYLDDELTVDNVTVLNKYNQVQTQKYSNDNAATYSYKSVYESPCVAPVSGVYDPYEKVTYNYMYDYENNPVGWSSPENTTAGKKAFSVHQISPVRAKYVLGSDAPYYANIIYDPTRTFNQRITQTSLSGIADGVIIDNVYSCVWNYLYDKLGRLEYKTGEEANFGKYVYEYLTSGDVTSNLISKITYFSKYTSGHSSANNDAVFEYRYDARGNIASKKESGRLYSSYDFSSESYFSYDDANRLMSETGTLIPEYSDNSLATTVNAAAESFVAEPMSLTLPIITPPPIIIDPPIINPPFYQDRHEDERRYEYTSSGKLSKIYNYYLYQKMNPVGLEKTVIYGSKDFHYNNQRGLLSGYSCSGVFGSDTVTYNYDNYGNRKQRNKNGTVTNYNWTRGNLLTSITQGSTETASYRYNHQGVRFYKSESGTETYYYLDGDKILGEDRVTGNVTTRIRYFYDVDGLSGFSHTVGSRTDYYYYIRDALDNIVMIADATRYVVARYAYDAWGNFKVYNDSGTEAASTSIGYINPFRWKSHYYDQATGFYYINGRYYDKDSCSYFDAEDITNIFANASIVNGLDRNGIKEDNIVELLPYIYCILTSNALSQDLTADAGEGISWWDKYRDVTMQAISATILVTSLVLAMIPPTSAFGIGLLTTTLTGGLINGLVSGITDSIAAGNNGYNHVTAFADGFARGFTVGVITSAIFYCVMSIANGLAKLANKPKATSEGVKITKRNVKRIEKYMKAHDYLIDEFPYNQEMMVRLKNSIGKTVKGGDANFYLHELKELTLVKKGMLPQLAHNETLKLMNMHPGAVYPKEVMQMYSEYFSPYEKSYWGI